MQIVLWLNFSDSGRAAYFNNGRTDFYAVVSLIKEMISGASIVVGFSSVVGDGFKSSSYCSKLSNPQNALVLPYHGRIFVVPVTQVKRLIEGKIDGIPFSVPT